MAAAGGSAAPRIAAGSAYAWYVLGVLFLVYILNFVDRQILSILAQDIKGALGLGDAQIGFLYGTAFAIFYSLFGIPLGRLADRWHRIRLIALGLALWSGMTVLSGFATTYGQLAIARVGVGIGEASASPSAYSLIGDYFAQERRALALAIYSAGLFVGSGFSLPLGGWVAHAWSMHFAAGHAPLGLVGWQAAFLAVGIPGILLALWVTTLREPPRERADGGRQSVWRAFAEDVAAILPPFTLWSVGRIQGALRRNVGLLAVTGAAAAMLTRLTGDTLQWWALGLGIYAVASWLQKLHATDHPTHALLFGAAPILAALAAFSLITFISYSLFFWIPPYAIRTFGVRADVIGVMMGIPGAFATAAGVILGGRLSDAWRRRSARGRIYVCMLSVIMAPPLLVAALASRDVGTLYVLAPLVHVVANLWLGSGAAAIQDCVLPRMRATAAATLLIATSLGLALGPYSVGRISALTGSLHTGILSVLAVSPLALLLLWFASRTLPEAERSRFARAMTAGEPAAACS